MHRDIFDINFDPIIDLLMVFNMVLFLDQTLSVEEKALLAQAARERADIVNKYDLVKMNTI